MAVSRFKRMSKTGKTVFIVCGVVLLALAVYLIFGDSWESNGYTSESYSSFYNQIEEQKIEEVSIGQDSIQYTKKDSDEKFRTDNPHSPTLEEYLLRNDVKVTVKKDGGEIFNTIFDVFFYIILIVIILVVFRKFIGPNSFKVMHKTGKTFKDVVGMDKLKKDMVQVMDMMQHPQVYARRGIRMPKGILLEGDPGNGKTLFAKALAGEAKVNFIPAKATDFESMFMAIGPMKVKLLFKKARRRAPCIVFIDEFDGIGTKRNYTGSAIETENTRIVTALLNELDGFENTSGVLVLAATNSIKALDEALIRPGRFDARFSVPYPNEEDRIKLVEMYGGRRGIDSSLTSAMLAKKFNGYSSAKIESVINKAALVASQRGATSFTMEDVDEALTEYGK